MPNSLRLGTLIGALALVLTACPDDAEIDLADEPTPAPADEAPGELGEEPGSELDGIEPTRVRYLATVEGAEDEEITINWDPPSMAVVFENGRVIHSPEETIICVAEGEDGEPECLRLPDRQDAEAVVQSFVPFFGTAQAVADQGELVGAQPTDDRSVAGRQASCVLLSPPEEGPQPPDAEGGTAELCQDVETGATLYYEVEGPDGIQRLEAIEVGSPEAADFEPLGPVEDVPEPEGE